MIEPAVLPAQIEQPPNLAGYAKTASGSTWHGINFTSNLRHQAPREEPTAAPIEAQLARANEISQRVVKINWSDVAFLRLRDLHRRSHHLRRPRTVTAETSKRPGTAQEWGDLYDNGSVRGIY